MASIKVVNNFKKIKDATASGLKKGLREAAITVLDQATALAPIDTGRLKNGLSYSLGGEIKGGNSYTGINKYGKPAEKASKSEMAPPNNSSEMVYIGTSLVYAAPQEYGTKFQAGQPYLRPAIDLTRKKILDIFGINIKRAIESEVQESKIAKVVNTKA